MNINQILYDLKNSLKENNINENKLKIKEIEKELKKNNLNEEDLKNIQNKINQIKKDNWVKNVNIDEIINKFFF